jgi:dTDP-4-dehydrorhamnose 3,5-epimerase
MKFVQTELKGAYMIKLDKLVDERGFFTRAWDINEFKKLGLKNNIVHCNISFSKIKGTIRGMHYQIPPYSESKLIRCTKGEIFDVIIDLRENSNTRYKWISTKLDSYQHNMLYVPEGFGHGFQTLEDNTEVYYQNSQIHKSEFERGVKFDDPFFNIKWPIDEKIVSDKDKTWPLFTKDNIDKK